MCLLIGANDNAKFWTAETNTAARAGCYEGYLEEVAEWTALWSRVITLASTAPLAKGLVKKPKTRPTSAKHKATAQPATAEPAGEDAAVADNVPSQRE